MSDLRVSSVKTRTGDSPRLPDCVVVTGVTTTTTFKGNLSGNVTGNVAGIVTGNVTGNISGTTGSFSGDVSVGGTVTYEDVSSVDSVGVITARDGIRVGAGESIGSDGAAVVYYGDGSNLSGVESGVVNFVASGTISNGATGKINIAGGVNSSQSSLTVGKTYYVQGDGTFATTPDSSGYPSVVAGTSISATEILVR